MVKEMFEMHTEAVGSEDGRHTYEIRRTWNKGKKKGLVVALYPTIPVEHCSLMDVSTMHLLNHAGEFGWGSVRIVNLYSTVFSSKPLASQLQEDAENIAYIESILEDKDIGEYDIVIAWGSSLSSHKKTMEAKLDILDMISRKKLEKQLKCITTEYMDGTAQAGTHPLYLGLHYAKDVWGLDTYPLQSSLKELEELTKKKPEKKDLKQAGKKNTTEKKKGQKKDVLQNQEQSGRESIGE